MFITWRRREGCWRCWPANPPPLHLQNPNPLAAPSLQISQKCYTVTASLLFRLTVKRIPQAGPFSALSRTTKYAYRMHPAVSYHAIPQPVSLLLKLYSIICSYFKYFTLLLGIFSWGRNGHENNLLAEFEHNFLRIIMAIAARTANMRWAQDPANPRKMQHKSKTCRLSHCQCCLKVFTPVKSTLDFAHLHLYLS